MKPSARPNLLATLGERLSTFEVPPHLQRPLRLIGYPAFALLIAFIAFTTALPRDKVKDRLETLLSQEPTTTQPMGLGVDVKAADLWISLLSRGIRAENVVLRSRPLRATDKPARYVLDQVKISVGLFGLLFQRPTYSFSVDAFGGTLEGSARITMTDNKYDIEGKSIALSAMQGLQTAVGLPIEGGVQGKLELDAPGRMLASSNGSLTLTIEDAVLGDGKAKLTIPGDAFMAAGLTIPRIRLGQIVVQVSIEKGKARFDSLRAHSPDIDLTIEGYMDMRDPLPSSQLHAFVRFKLSDAIIKKEPTLEIVVNSLGGAGKRPDGFIGAQLTGSLGMPSFVANRNPPPGVVTKAEGGGMASPTIPPPTAQPPIFPVQPLPPPTGMMPAPPPATPDAAQPEAPPPPKEVAPPPTGMRAAQRVEVPPAEAPPPPAAPPTPPAE